MRGALALAGYWNGAKDSTATPEWLYNQLDSEFHFDFDPCPLNPTFDGLALPWGLRNYVNPPYSDKAPWIRKSLIEHIQGKTIVMLLPVDTSSRWFQRWIHPYASQIRFLNQRLIFPPNKHHAAYASMIVVYDHVNYSEKYITWNRKL